MQSFVCWQDSVNPALSRRIGKALRRAMGFLAKSQRADGAWVPLWFGNEHSRNQENPVYGTARTLTGLNHVATAGYQVAESLRSRAANFLQSVKNNNGGWGGDFIAPQSIEETAVAIEALGEREGALALAALMDSDGFPAAIGLYFARLWYYERLYPIIFATSALGSVVSKQF
jgi:squalene-hopene/tetraprenyl-beta-curcumene cyclase